MRLFGAIMSSRRLQVLDQETLQRIDFQNKSQTLLEELEFFRRLRESELRDLRSQAARDTTSERASDRFEIFD